MTHYKAVFRRSRGVLLLTLREALEDLLIRIDFQGRQTIVILNRRARYKSFIAATGLRGARAAKANSNSPRCPFGPLACLEHQEPSGQDQYVHPKSPKRMKRQHLLFGIFQAIIIHGAGYCALFLSGTQRPKANRHQDGLHTVAAGFAQKTLPALGTHGF